VVASSADRKLDISRCRIHIPLLPPSCFVLLWPAQRQASINVPECITIRRESSDQSSSKHSVARATSRISSQNDPASQPNCCSCSLLYSSPRDHQANHEIAKRFISAAFGYLHFSWLRTKHIPLKRLYHIKRTSPYYNCCSSLLHSSLRGHQANRKLSL